MANQVTNNLEWLLPPNFVSRIVHIFHDFKPFLNQLHVIFLLQFYRFLLGRNRLRVLLIRKTLTTTEVSDVLRVEKMYLFNISELVLHSVCSAITQNSFEVYCTFFAIDVHNSNAINIQHL